MLLPYKDINHAQTAPIVTVAIIAANCLLFFYFRLMTMVLDGYSYGTVVYYLGLVPARFFSLELFSSKGPVPVALTPITSMFMHGGILHLAGNMLFLWIFGNNVEDRLGHFKYFIFYIVTGLAACAGQMIFSLGSDVPMVGASGAISGVMGAYMCLWPRAKIRSVAVLIIFVSVIEIPAFVVLGYWILIQIVEGIANIGSHSGVAFFAHIGGFFSGYALMRIGKKNARR